MAEDAVIRSGDMLVYAMKDGHVVHVSDAKRGLECDCTCPVCGDRLIAKQGKERKWHFAHESGGECAAAPETALHRLAKDIFLEAKSMLVPELKAQFHSTIYTVVPRHCGRISNVAAESGHGDVRPDIDLILDGYPCFVEVFVTHAVDGEKLAKLKKFDAAVLEVDLSGVPRNIPRSVLQRMLLDSVKFSRWLYHPKREAFIREKQRERDEAARRREEAMQRRKAEERQREIAARTQLILGRMQADVDDIVIDVLTQMHNDRMERKRQEDLKRKREEWQRRLEAEAAWEERTGVSAIRPLEFDRPTPAEAFEYLAKEVDVFDHVMRFFDERKIARAAAEEYSAILGQMTDSDRLLSIHRCYRCGGTLINFPWIKGKDGRFLYVCSECGEVWMIEDNPRRGLDFVPVGMVLCPDCGSSMVCSQNGRSLEWHCEVNPDGHRNVRRRIQSDMVRPPAGNGACV